MDGPDPGALAGAGGVSGVPRRLSWVGGGLVVALTALIVGLIRFAGPAIYCGDGWFHVRYATILRDHGISRTFPWWQESFLKDHFADLNLVYHLLLIPFTWGNELLGARVSTIVFAALAMGALWWALRSLRVPWPWLFALALLAAAPDFAYWLTYSRPLVLAFAMAFAGTATILRGRAVATFVLTFLYAQTHCSFHFLPCLALLHETQRTIPGGAPLKDRFRTTLAAFGGAVAGSVLTPYFPNNLSFWWTQNVDVLRASWAMGDLLRVGTEMMPVRTDALLSANLAVFVLFGLAIYGMTRVGRVSDDARTLFVTAFGFFALTFLSQRFAELWAPYTVLLVGVVARDLLADAGPAPWLSRLGPNARTVRLAAAGLLLIVLAAGLRRTLLEDGAAAAAEDQPLWREAGRWMKANVPAGETIFHLGWDEFPELFYEDTTHRYLIGWDPTFFYVTSPERCRIWENLARGRTDDAWAAVRKTFGCRFAFVPRRYVSFRALARRDPRFREIWSDPNAIVYRVDDDGATIGGWSATGWSPDPDRRKFDEALAGEPGGPPHDVRGRTSAPSSSGFVDVARLAAVPPAAQDACAVVGTTLDAAQAGNVTLGLTSDDEIKLYVGGDPVYAHSPYQTPPPGSPGGPPIPLDRIFSGGSDGPAEVEVSVALRAGKNAIVVKDCRAGDDFGFILRRRGGARR
jgi:hypothetical protein